MYGIQTYSVVSVAVDVGEVAVAGRELHGDECFV
jgi:hypothetical protein